VVVEVVVIQDHKVILELLVSLGHKVMLVTLASKEILVTLVILEILATLVILAQQDKAFLLEVHKVKY
jgi:hypothetical protein